MMVAGGALTIGGVMWVALNRGKRVMPNVEVQPTSGGIAATVRFQF